MGRGIAKRIIPCLDVKDGETVKGTNFINLRKAGDPVELGKAYSASGADELVFLGNSARKFAYVLLTPALKTKNGIVTQKEDVSEPIVNCRNGQRKLKIEVPVKYYSPA